MMNDQHAVINPSSLGRITKCPGYLWMKQYLPYLVDSGSESDEGNLAHEYCAHVLTDNPFEREMPDDMRENCQLYIDYVQNTLSNPWIETKVQIRSIHPELCYGTFDAGGIVNDVLHVIDLKYGFKWVTDYDQLIAYASGILAQLTSDMVKVNRIILTYVQPRGRHPDGPIRSIELTIDQLAHEVARIRQRVELGLTPDAPLISGNHCYRCPRQYDCPANTQAAANIIDAVSDVTKTCDSSMISLETELDVLEHAQSLIKERVINLQEVLEHRIINGERSNLYEIGFSSGHRKYIVSDTELELECQLEGVELTKEVKKTPAELERAGMPKDAMKRLARSPQIKKLQKINFNSAKKVFKL